MALKVLVVPWRVADYAGCCNVLNSAAVAALRSTGLSLGPECSAYSTLGLDNVVAGDIWYTSYAHDDSGIVEIVKCTH